jgi:thiamine biosynthesis protein ThiI
MIEVVGRYSEIFLKRGRRRYFIAVLANNVRAALADLPGTKVYTPHGRLRVNVPDATEEQVVERLSRVFGLNDFSVIDCIERYEQSDEEILKEIEALVAKRAKEAWDGGARTFRITSKRTDKTFFMSSATLAPHLAEPVVGVCPDFKVQLKGADADIEVELRPEAVFVSCGRKKGPGGLPVKSNGRALLLLSGGIDSPVAGWLTQKRGVRIDAVSFDSFPLTGPQAKEKVRTLARVLGRWAPAVTLHMVPFGDIQMLFREQISPEQLLLMYRRSMIRMADKLAKDLGALALVTGECIGQVASQTLPNIRAIEAVTLTPVLRPLVTFDKCEVIDLARKLGTYPISIQPHDDCCSLFVPAHPELKGDPERLAAMEERLETLAALEEEALSKREVIHTDGYGIAKT